MGRATAPVLFITGTDTGVGKTILASLLVAYGRLHRRRVAAGKPFCTGTPDDVELLYRMQGGDLPRSTINPFYFAEPLAPRVAARRAGKSVPLRRVLRWADRMRRRHACVLLEGCGGLLAPWGEDYSAVDLMKHLHCAAVVVARNRLGVLNHVLLTVHHLWAEGIRCHAVVCMDEENPDGSARSNAPLLGEILGSVPVVRVPFLGENLRSARRLHELGKKLKKTLAPVFFSDTVCAPFERQEAG